MGSACFPWLCLLLLSGPALRPGIAAPTAAGTNDSSSNKTNVTVYRCRDCDSKICKLSNYTVFEIIGETQNGMLENDIIQLVTSETQIIMCFQQEIKYLGEYYAIVWEKGWGIGESCGNLELGENWVHHITEEEKICCAVETEQNQPYVNNLNCHIESKKKNQSSIYEFLDDRNLDNPPDPGSNNSIGITAAFLILGVCAAAALVLYCVHSFRKRQGPIIVLYQILKGAIKPNQAYESRRSQPFEASSTNETSQAFMPAASFSNKV